MAGPILPEIYALYIPRAVGLNPRQSMPVSNDTPLVLGSSSPRRRQILLDLGLPIRVEKVDVDEEPRPGEAALPYLERVVSDKLGDAAGRIGAAPAGALLVADTTVVLDGDILGKPSDVSGAEALLSRLVGRTHVVYTRYAISTAARWDVPVVARTVASRVTMRPATPEEVSRYATSGEGLDKAGAYAVQGLGAFLVQTIEGSYTNVIGLPACEVILDLRDQNLLGAYP